MPKQVSKKRRKAKRLRTGWKKVQGGYCYIFKPTVATQYKIKEIQFPGFKQKPIGLNLIQSGGGFNLRQVNKVGGNHFLAFLENTYKKQIKLVVYADGNGSKTFRILKKSVIVSISFPDFKDLLADLGIKARDGRNAAVRKRLADFFPQVSVEDAIPAAAALGEIKLTNLSDSDHDSIADFIKKYINLNSQDSSVLERLQTDLVLQGQKKGLDKVIKKFEGHLADSSFDEKSWQKFLHEEVFYFLLNYVESVRETNVNFGKTTNGEKKPDFVWIDLYGFLDVFEIKTPWTDILAKKRDDSHKNYYFSSSAAKAISQIEKYILFLENNVEGYQKYLSKQTNIPFAVLKPKAFLIIGRSDEFKNNEDKKRDFRLLRRLFKNIEFITFDELLDNLKNLSSKFEKKKKLS